MKKLILFSSLTFISLVLFQCKKKDNPTPSEPSSSLESFTWKGTGYVTTGDSLVASSGYSEQTYYSSSGKRSFKSFSLEGYNAKDHLGLNFYFKDIPSTGIYTGKNDGTLVNITIWGNNYNLDQNDTIVVTKSGNSITAKVTNGNFNKLGKYSGWVTCN